MKNEGCVEAVSFIKKYGVFYAIGIVIAFALKYYYSRADAEALDWILAPTVRWVRVLSGITFEKQQGAGYINHEYQFIIAPVCAGMNFMVIAFSTLIISFTHRIKTWKSRLLWMGFCLFTVYLYTILVNSLRIIPSIFLPQLNIYGSWITPERVHTIEGTVVYFASLLLLWFVADKVLKRITPVNDMNGRPGESYAGKEGTGKASISMLYKYSIPVLMYFAVTLGIPFINGAFRNNRADFLEHAVLVIAVCAVVIFIWVFLTILKKHVCTR
jgi:exosortase K